MVDTTGRTSVRPFFGRIVELLHGPLCYIAPLSPPDRFRMTIVLKYLGAYPEQTRAQVCTLIEQDRLAAVLRERYPTAHGIRTDKALYGYVQDLKDTYLRNAEPIAKVAFDSKIQVVQQALGLHTAISRVQGGKLKAKHEIRIGTVFRDAPEAFLRMIAVHELVHTSN